MISFACPRCQSKLTVKDEAGGKKARCPQCQTALVVPGKAQGIANEATLPPAAMKVQEGRTVAPKAAAAEHTSPTLASGARVFASQTGGGDDSLHEDTEAYDFLAPAEQPDELGRLGPYRILKVLGKGGMGVVFLAEETLLKRQVAVKAMLPALAASDSNRKRFLREAQAAAALEHEHIIQIYYVGEDRGVPFVAMPLLKASRWMSASGPREACLSTKWSALAGKWRRAWPPRTTRSSSIATSSRPTSS